jgi:HK97 family phage prohead protease
MQNRAYSILDIKSIDAVKRIIVGTATTPTVDRVGDIIEPLGVKFSNPMPFLWQHDHHQPIGTVNFKTPTKDGIDFVAQIASIDEPGRLKDRLDEAWQCLQLGLVRAVSIGFRPIEYSFMEDSNGIRFLESEVYELSAVTVPANADALIDSVKSIDAALRKAAGIADPEIPRAPVLPAKKGKGAVVVRLGGAAQARAPFVVNKIHPVRKLT